MSPRGKPYVTYINTVINQTLLFSFLFLSSLTSRGEAYRNASIRDLLEFAGSRGAVQVTKERALVGRTSAPVEAAAFATDAFAGRTVMDVEEFEGRLSSVRFHFLGEPTFPVTNNSVTHSIFHFSCVKSASRLLLGFSSKMQPLDRQDKAKFELE